MKGRLRLLNLLTQFLVFILVAALPLMASDELTTQEWVALYNGPVGNGNDMANAIAIDSSGNVYVTGYSYGSETYDDYATVKYDTDGNELWVARYNGPGNDYDYPCAIAVDSSGNVYVTGRSKGIGTSWDYATVKYDTNGNELWVKRYNSPTNNDDIATAMAVDSLGNVYVTGWSEDFGPWYDYATVKYDTDGNRLWVARYTSLPDDYDEATAITVDSWGNVYVTGKSGYFVYYDYLTVKYDAEGNEHWVKRYNGSGKDYDEATAMAVDSSGNIYVTGKSSGIGTDLDYATVKYDTNGNELWVKRYNGPANDSDEVRAIAVDSSGNIYVTGKSSGIGTDLDYATVKYDTNGNELWVKRYNGPANDSDEASAIAVDVSGNIYVTGWSFSGTTLDDYVTVKYDTFGNELWVRRYNGPGDDVDYANDIVVDELGNVYVTGGTIGIGMDYDYATMKNGGVGEVGLTMDLPEGWSMISLLLRPEAATVEALFPNAQVTYKYQKGAGYVRVKEDESLEIGMGYWILLNESQSYIIRGALITEYTIPVENIWYMIGGCTFPARTMIKNGSISVIYVYRQDIGYKRLLESELLQPQKGYWILFNNAYEGAEFTASIPVSK